MTIKLLVDAPSGAQEMLEIDVTGSYYDESRVLWDERTDGPLPEITLGGMVRDGDTLVFSQSRMDEHTAATKPPVPHTVTRRQALQALLLAGMLDDVEAAISAIDDPTQRRLAEIEYQNSTEFVRDRPFLLQMASALNLSSADLDNLFITASTL
jgi:hypothetical protein